MLRLTRTTLGLAVLLLMVAATSVVAADDFENDICLNSSGRVRFIPPGTGCRVSERLVAWNSQTVPGPQGPQGPQGPEGAVGPKGSDGAVGPQGAAGPKGSDGAVGPQGAAGPKGSDGAVGPQGPQGAAGPKGADGAEGPQGPQGAAGPKGSDGAEGPQGLQGAVGPKGSDGAEGKQGAVGPQGAEGPAASGPGPALVLDSKDVIIGRYISRTGDVLVHIGDDHFVVTATQQGFIPTGSFIHGDAGCTDTPAIAASASALSLAQVALVKLGEAWLPDFGAKRITLPADSTYFYQTFFADGGSTDCLKDAVSSEVTLMPLRQVSLSGFSAPFHLQ